MKLNKYHKKRDFKNTPEPKGELAKKTKNAIFVVQKHDARRLHYDLRLESNGVLKSWAIPKEISNAPGKYLAIMVEDHPYEYKNFEGVIPQGNYGAGPVIIWDRGYVQSFHSEDKNKNWIDDGIKDNLLKFVLIGKKLKGRFTMVKLKAREGKDNQWLLVKDNDEYVGTPITDRELSVKSGKTIDEVMNGREMKHIPGIDLTRLPKIKMLPDSLGPMLAKMTDRAFDDKDWLFEVKYDGYRALAFIQNKKTELRSRNGLNFSDKFPKVRDELNGIGYDCVLDGELVSLDKEGKSDFQLLQDYLKSGQGDVHFFVFDILYLDGHDLTNLPLGKRKEILKKVLPSRGGKLVKYAEEIYGSGKTFFSLAEKTGLEGIMAKKISSTYLPGKRSDDWLKIKIGHYQEAVVAGFTQPRGARKYFGSLILGIYKNNELVYIGHTGGGFTGQDLKDTWIKMEPLISNNVPFNIKPKTNEKPTWLLPRLVCEVKFNSWTKDGLLRQPIFYRWRTDKEPSEVEREAVNLSITPDLVLKNSAKSKFSHLDKVYFPVEGYTKGDVINYYDRMSEYILPYLKDRAENLNRHPNGIEAESFYHKNMPEQHPDWIKTVKIYSSSNKKNINYLVCDNKDTLLYMANLGCIEINPWSSRLENLESPDYAIIDLDPNEIEFKHTIKVAQTVKRVLDDLKIKAYLKTSGGRGLHILIPLGAKYNYQEIYRFVHLIGLLVQERVPDITSLERSPNKRKGRVYLDYLQNLKGQTIASVYSIRPKPGAPVSTPLSWDELNSRLDPKKYNIKTIFRRLKKTGDIFKGVLGDGIDLKKTLEILEKK